MRLIVFVLLALYVQSLNADERPNIVVVFIDDMGWGDFSCFGNTEASTPNIDAIAKEGIRFHQFYVNSPICSPSRVAISTGQYPQRHRVTSFLNNRADNQKRGVANWLDPSAPMLARSLKQAGYATAHCGKWHMGGQRDVDDAPPITDYGFDFSLTNFEGMGPKLLPLTEVPKKNGGVKQGRIWEGAERLGQPVTWMKRSEITGGFVDAAIKFIDESQANQKPFFINLWPDDVHAPWFPDVANWSANHHQRYLAVLQEMDQQFERLFQRIAEDPALCDNTLILICSDNGPDQHGGSAGPFSGLKATLFEGGIRSPLIVWGPGFINADQRGIVNETSVFAAIDLVPSLLQLAGVPTPDEIAFDGEDLSNTLIGKSIHSRTKPIFFRRPPDRKEFHDLKNLPDLAVRDGNWKLHCDYDGSLVRLYDLHNDPAETNNLAEQHPDVVQRLVAAIKNWNSQLPRDAGDPDFGQAE